MNNDRHDHLNSNRMQQFRQAAAQAGIRLTAQRLEIFRLVAGSGQHPTAEDIYSKLHKKIPTVSLDTVYRTLHTLAELGLVRPLSPRSEGVRYDPNPLRHHHFVCIECGLIGDFVNHDLDALPLPVEACSFGRSLSLQVEVRGICDKCLKRKANLLNKDKNKSNKE